MTWLERRRKGNVKKRTRKGFSFKKFPAAPYSPRRSPAKYHRRRCVSLPCSEWERVVPHRHSHRKGETKEKENELGRNFERDTRNRSSPRPIRTGQLNTLPCLHLRPINLVFFQESYSVKRMGDLILGTASHLDAFSAYPHPTWLPSTAPGETTGTPAVGSSRSSRTRDDFPQISNARDG